MKYKYFSKKDSEKEPIGIVDADDLTGAQKLAAAIKRMTILKFNKLFSVEKFTQWKK